MVIDDFVDTVRDAIGDVDIDDAQPQIVRKGEDHPKFNIKNEGEKNIIELNIDAWDKESREDVIRQLGPLFHEQEGIFLPETDKYKIISESGISDTRINEIVDFFSQYLSDNQTTLLRRCLSIRQDWERDEIYISRQEMDSMKYDLSQDFDHAFTVSNLVSSGYYDKDGYFREIFENLDESGVDHSEYRRIYSEILQEKPFFVFVGGSDQPPGVVKEIKNKLSKYTSYPIQIEFVDALAVGSRARGVLERSILEFQRDTDCVTMLVEVDNPSTRYRIYPDSVDGMTLE
ncbi:hypothetical protein [Halosimplex marinum]|uniref:hypothetical protein n=1 Tax=Halosimplex marinum TaxID=3396620 RepID=UPI003F565201